MKEQFKTIKQEAMNFADIALKQFQHTWNPGMHNENRYDAMEKWNELFQEKFAELIVQECVSIMDITDVADFRGIELALKIKQHFGVE